MQLEQAGLAGPWKDEHVWVASKFRVSTEFSTARLSGDLILDHHCGSGKLQVVEGLRTPLTISWKGVQLTR